MSSADHAAAGGLTARRRYLRKASLVEALAHLESLVPAPLEPPERVAVEESLGRVTAAPVFARRSVPHYHGAAMDGIAVRAEDTFGASEARPIVLCPAGPQPGPRSYVQVDTGEPLPAWADAVIMIEHVFPARESSQAPGREGLVEIRSPASPWQHVRVAGEDIVATEMLLPRGHRLRPYDIGALLAAGHLDVAVRRRPRIAILPTGSELVEPEQEPAPGNIVEFNSRVVAAFASAWGAKPQRLPPVPDDLQVVGRALAAAAADADAVTVIAGSSAGTRDHTAAAVEALGELLVHGIEIMPGKPAIVARISGKPVIGVPGYPVSAIVVCEQLLEPLVARMLGVARAERPRVRTAVAGKVPSRLGLEEFVRVNVGEVGGRLSATPLPRGAGAITTMVRADGFLRVPSRSEGINAGEQVEVELLRPLAEVQRTILFTGSHDLAVALLEDCLRAKSPEVKISTANVGSLGGLLALGRGEAHVAGAHLLDPRSGTYNLPAVRRHLRHVPVLVVNLVRRQQGLLVATGNPKGIHSIADLAREDVRFINRQPGAGTRVLLDYCLRKHAISPGQVRGYERQEPTHMAVAMAVASGVADVGLGVHQAATALGLDFVPVEVEDYDLVLLAEFAETDLGQKLLAAVGSAEFAAAAARLAGYSTELTGTVKLGPTKGPRARRPAARRRAAARKRRASH